MGVNSNPSNFKGDDLPVDTVSWDNAKEFCRKLSTKESRPYRLPYEAEWEYAARAGTSTPFWQGATITTDQVNCNGTPYRDTDPKGENRARTTPVKQFKANSWGLYDMGGNLWQWCEDWYGDYPNGPIEDPKGSNTGTLRSVRGGSWYDLARHCRAAIRFRLVPANRNDIFGFRLALEMTGGATAEQGGKVQAGEGTLVVQVNEANAEVFVDGEKVTVTGKANEPVDLRLTKGRHKLEVRKETFQTASRDVEVLEKGRQVVEIRMDPLSTSGLSPSGNTASQVAVGTKNPAEWSYEAVSGEPRLILQFHPDRHGSFGLLMAKEQDPNEPGRFKRLTYDERGRGDNIIVKIDGKQYFFGVSTTDCPNKVEILRKPRIGQINTKTFKDYNVEVRQHVELVPGSTGSLDNCLVYYTILNNNKDRDCDVGLRVLMDTFIGANDGVPFTIPGRKGFLDTMKELTEKEIPDYIEMIEKPDNPKDLGTVARMGLRHIKLPGIDLEPIDKMRICLYPGSQIKWDWAMEPMNKNPKQKDSCVALYWVVQKMKAGDERRMGYTYGLSELSIGPSDAPIALSAPSSVQPGAEFVVTAYVWKSSKGQKVKLDLSSGLKLAKDESVEKTVEENGTHVQLSWRVLAGEAGEYPVAAKMGSTMTKPLKVVVSNTSIFR